MDSKKKKINWKAYSQERINKGIKKYFKFFLSFKGRLNRKPFAGGIIALSLIIAVLGSLIGKAGQSIEQAEASLKALESAREAAPALPAPAEGAASAEKPPAEPASGRPLEEGHSAKGLLVLFLSLMILIMLFPFLAAFIGFFALSVRRLHDLNFSGWWYLPLMALGGFLSWPEQAKYSTAEGPGSYSFFIDMFSPSAGYFPPALLVFNAACMILFFLVKGTKGENKYGPDPLSSP